MSDEILSQDTRPRCQWGFSDPMMLHYHDTEWGKPVHDSRALWEKLMLDGFQAGLSWRIILKKREAFRLAFCGFDPQKVAQFTEEDIERLVGNADIIRSRAKINAVVKNARAYLAMQQAGEEFGQWIWSQVGGKPIQHVGPVPTKDALSERISKDLKKRGFTFVGPTIVYAWMEATGLINTHHPDCFRRIQVAAEI
ncbi:DNA-3-methyladenine glycosylase I [Hafnia psychrotolerans]|uniref:DNA-3-methyladenine glycosylase I n=1 Tax=Hafnia psychrotolerans TaxID=1477018 RepID=A0ABQ1GS90_9GAMM|nr:DNA-3-methyladenine glycosylase I [Hafnia psychrotolerans]GGA48946.1 DNA-3-methyladenine glycosylase I [Hafnia psychrotolerans]